MPRKKKNKKADKKAKVDSIDKLITKIQKEHGKTAIRKMDDKSVIAVETISTGSLLVDEALGIGGFPRGRIVEVFGPEGSGKTTLALHCIAEAQKQGGHALFVDAEHAFSSELARKLKIKSDLLMVCQPDSGEQGLDVLEMGVSSGKLAIAVVDSVSALTPQAEIDGDMGDSHMGLQARLMGQAMRKINGCVSKTNTLVIFINQLRQKIGVVFGNPETTSGGNALKFYASVRMDIRRVGSIKGKGKKKDKDGKHEAKVIGNKVRIKIIKNKLAPPFKTIETDLIFGYGFNKEGELLDIGYDLDIIEMKGSWYNYRGEKIGQGKSAACKTLRKAPNLYDSIVADIHMAQGS
jgi:recombination protein RecA